jgi:hypothetical protein
MRRRLRAATNSFGSTGRVGFTCAPLVGGGSIAKKDTRVLKKNERDLNSSGTVRGL